MQASIKRHTSTAILLAAVLTLVALTLLVRLPNLHGDTLNTVMLAEESTGYDLSGITDWNKRAVILLPGSTYYPSTLLTPETADAAIPISTNEFAALRADYLSQRFVLSLPDTNEAYTLTFKLSGRHAMRVYVNGTLAGETGRVGTTKQDTEVWENSITVSASPANSKMDILLNSAQFYHIRGGANLATLSVQKATETVTPRLSEPLEGLVMTGALLCAAALLMSVYLFLSHTKATLYFALACLAMSLRECVQSQSWTYFPMDGNTAFMLEYLSVALLTIFLSLYLGQYAAGPILRGIQIAAIAGSLVYGGITLLGDSLLYTSLLKFYQLWLIVCIITGTSGLFWNMRRPSREQAAVLYGIAVFYLAAVSDIAMYRDLFGATYSNAPISEAAMLIFTVAQTVSLFFMNSRVLAESKETEQRLASDKAALEKLDRMKTEFLGNVSHELKTPLTVMSGYAQTTKQLSGQLSPPLSEEVSRRMTLISSEADRLSLMVGQILDVTRMEEGQMVMEPVRCHLDEIVHAAVNTHYPMLNKNQNRLSIRIDRGLPDLYADPARISQIIVNLISNAVRFTSDGEIGLFAGQDGNRVLIRVSDTGVGIASERLAHIFERYHQKEASGAGQDTGTGLGLYICKHIVEQHGGSIWIESLEGHGTSVFFTLPAANTGPC
ncbi:ATP-binding protein [Oscillibacter sp.]|uniref:sensor histidine kinase n=1 Tax=Oscillibacter sp. TaxID=1945593 RepID=UPI00289AC9AB|nr:ATP-binding protein [Oscillibacter sp.]